MEGLSNLRDFGWRSFAGLDRIALGRRGERIAERYLRRKGYRILERNFRGAGAEIDLVAMDGETLVFVEVKTRRTAHSRDAAGSGERIQAAPSETRGRDICPAPSRARPPDAV